MFKPLIAGALLLASISAVQAAECEFPFDAIVGEFSAAGSPVMVVPDDELAQIVGAIETVLGTDYGDVTRAFFAQSGGKTLLGLEVDDCLLPPINLGPVPAPARLSGKDPKTGQIGA